MMKQIETNVLNGSTTKKWMAPSNYDSFEGIVNGYESKYEMSVQIYL